MLFLYERLSDSLLTANFEFFPYFIRMISNMKLLFRLNGTWDNVKGDFIRMNSSQLKAINYRLNIIYFKIKTSIHVLI